MHDVFGVAVVLGEDQRLGHLGAAGEDLGGQLVAEGAHERADLVHGHHVAVELVGVVGEVFVELLPAHLAGELVAQVHVVAGFDLAAGFAHLGADAVDVVVDVDAVGHGLLVAVLHDQVLVEEAEGLLAGRGGEADQAGVEVLQHLPPQVVDGAVASSVTMMSKVSIGMRGVVVDGLGGLEQAVERGAGFFFQVFRQLAALEHAEHALDGADDHARGLVQGVVAQVLDDVLLAELEVVDGETYWSNSFFVCRPRLPRSTRNSTRRAPAYLMSR